MDNREPMRHFRASDELWQSAQETVRKRGDGSVSRIIRRLLAAYVGGTHVLPDHRRNMKPDNGIRGANSERNQGR